MSNNPNKVTQVIHAVFALVALIILIDFAWPGNPVDETILDVQKRRQQYYNAARNHHYTYMVVTDQHQFLVSEGFATAELKDKKIHYAVSPIFQEVNWYRLLDAESKSYYSLRIASGLVLPLCYFLALVAVYRFKRNIGIGLLILQIILIGDLILLTT